MKHERTIVEPLSSSLNCWREVLAAGEHALEPRRCAGYERVKLRHQTRVLRPGVDPLWESSRNEDHGVGGRRNAARSSTPWDTFGDGAKRVIQAPAPQVAQRHANLDVQLHRFHVLNFPILQESPLLEQANGLLHEGPPRLQLVGVGQRLLLRRHRHQPCAPPHDHHRYHLL